MFMSYVICLHSEMQIAMIVLTWLATQGGGRLVLSAAALPQGACLPAINLTDQGQVTSIRIMAHTAGEIRAASQVISLKQWQPGCSDPGREELTVQPALGIYQKIGVVSCLVHLTHDKQRLVLQAK